MKIVIVGPAYPLRGGNALLVAHLYEALSRQHSVNVISFSRLYPGFLFPGVRQHDVSAVPMKQHPARHVIDCLNPFTWWKAARIIAQSKLDLLVFTWWNPFFGPLVRTMASFVKSRTKKPVLVVVENVISHEGRAVDIALTKLALGQADRFLVLSANVEKSLTRLYPEKKIYRSSLPVYDCYNVTTALTQEEAQRQLGIQNKKVVLFFGYVRKYKGLMNLIEAFPAVKNAVPNVHLLIVGEFYDARKPYDDAIKKLGIEQAVTVIPRYVANEDVHLYFTASNLVVLPYREATQSGILSIALAFARPAVVTDVGGLSEWIKEGKTGFVIPPHGNEKLTEAIVRYFVEGKEREFARAMERERQNNSFTKIADVFNEIFRSFHES